MKKTTCVLVITSVLVSGVPAWAGICYLDDVPAATLLLPYFEVEWQAPAGAGVTTLFSINNAAPEPALAHVILWTNWAAPTVAFDVFLTGYDTVTFNLWDLFQGNLPLTADQASDPDDAISPHQGIYADHSHWDGSFPHCAGVFSLLANPVLGGNAYERLTEGHTGRPLASLGGNFLGAPCPDPDHACGYITIDSVSACSPILDPSDPTYFAEGGSGIANNRNQLWGDYQIVDPANGFASGDALVHIEASDDFHAGTDSVPANPTGYTFYGRYTQARGGVDHREPLGTSWAARYLNSQIFEGGTDLIIWRDPTANHLLSEGVSAEGPDWFPLNETEIIVFDEQEDAVEICPVITAVVPIPGGLDVACFGYGTYRYTVGDVPVDVPYTFGTIYLNLNLPTDSPTGDVDFPADPPGTIAQSYVAAEHRALGLYTVGLNAISVSHACEHVDPLINQLPNVIHSF